MTTGTSSATSETLLKATGTFNDQWNLINHSRPRAESCCWNTDLQSVSWWCFALQTEYRLDLEKNVQFGLKMWEKRNESAAISTTRPFVDPARIFALGSSQNYIHTRCTLCMKVCIRLYVANKVDHQGKIRIKRIIVSVTVCSWCSCIHIIRIICWPCMWTYTRNVTQCTEININTAKNQTNINTCAVPCRSVSELFPKYNCLAFLQRLCL